MLPHSATPRAIVSRLCLLSLLAFLEGGGRAGDAPSGSRRVSAAQREVVRG